MMALQPGDAEQWEQLVTAIEADRGEIRRRISRRLRAELPAYRTLPDQSLDKLGGAPFERLIVALRERRAPDLESLAGTFRRSGAQRAREGVPVAELLQTMLIAMEEVRHAAERLTLDGAVRDAALLQLTDIVLAWRDQGTIELARGHRTAEIEDARREAHRRSSLVEAVLFGGLTPTDVRVRVETHGLDPDAEYRAIRARPASRMRPDEAAGIFGTWSSNEDRRGLVAWFQGDVCGFVQTLPRQSIPFAVGTSAPVPLGTLQTVFPLATRALETALALGRTGVHDLGSLGLYPAVLDDLDVGASLEARYVVPFTERGAAGTVVLDTVACYLAQNRGLAATAAALFVHANTVRYRIARFEELSGVSLRDTQSLAEVWWALERRRLRAADVPGR